jgi:hypothetical protein
MRNSKFTYFVEYFSEILLCKFYKSVDFKNNEIPHVHYWHSKQVGRKRHDSHNTYELSNRDQRLMNAALAYNKKIN